MPRVPTWIYFCDSSAMLPLPFAHIAGIPVEETLLSFGPVFAVAGERRGSGSADGSRKPSGGSGAKPSRAPRRLRRGFDQDALPARETLANVSVWRQT